MGDPKKQRKKYSGPTHPWQAARIEEERIILKDYGLKNKKEIWKMNSLLRNFSRQAKRLVAIQTKQAELERKQLMKKISSLGLISEGAKLEDILAITLRNLLDRRLQTLVHRKNLARSIKQARQFIIHEHIMVGDEKMTTPSYLVKVEEEPLIRIDSKSPFSNPEHAERAKTSAPKKVNEQKPVKPRRGRWEKFKGQREKPRNKREEKRAPSKEKAQAPKKE